MPPAPRPARRVPDRCAPPRHRREPSLHSREDSSTDRWQRGVYEAQYVISFCGLKSLGTLLAPPNHAFCPPARYNLPSAAAARSPGSGVPSVHRRMCHTASDADSRDLVCSSRRPLLCLEAAVAFERPHRVPRRWGETEPAEGIVTEVPEARALEPRALRPPATAEPRATEPRAAHS